LLIRTPGDIRACPESTQAIVGERPRATRTTLLTLGAVYGCYGVIGVARHRYEIFALMAVFLIFPAVALLRPPTADTAGIRRPWRRPSAVSWSDVASVAAPVSGLPGVRLTLINGKTVRLLDIPPTKSALVAALGGKELFAPPPVRPPSPVRAARSDVEIADDVQQRAKALWAEWRRLDGQLPHRAPRPPD